MQNEEKQPELKRTEKFRVRSIEPTEHQYSKIGLNRVGMLLEQRKLAEDEKEKGKGKWISH